MVWCNHSHINSIADLKIKHLFSGSKHFPIETTLFIFPYVSNIFIKEPNYEITLSKWNNSKSLIYQQLTTNSFRIGSHIDSRLVEIIQNDILQLSIRLRTYSLNPKKQNPAIPTTSKNNGIGKYNAIKKKKLKIQLNGSGLNLSSVL